MNEDLTNPSEGSNSRQHPPDPSVPEKPKRRRFEVDYKRRILQEADNCTKSGQMGDLLRREGLYASQLCTWRQQRDRGLLGQPRGRKSTHHPAESECKQLRRENQNLKRQLQKAQTILEIQKKASELMGIDLPPYDSEGSSE